MTLDTGIILATIALATSAGVVNLIAARRGPYGLRVQCGVRGALAALYVPAYVWLLTNMEHRAVWSQTIVGLSLFSWVAVWNLPAFIALRLERQARATAPGDV